MELEKMAYKDAFKRLQEIQQLIEGNKLDVDELSTVLKEATALLKVCKDKLFVVNEETKKILEGMS
ncbi:MAG: exodeoxyribonuclease VII small subunit [Candidatus Symbiothrix sp.]|jgi:exodeoxyribonuclease VII small subunit|nr:exodeoxyribonuclease VII small subunit [Candidatus Symbiothrix sp.]